MSSKPNLLIVGNYNRRDYIDIFESCRDDFNFYFLEYTSSLEIKDNYYQSYGNAIFWGDYLNVTDLLQRVNPHKVLFYFIESYFHVLLNIACKRIGIQTYHIDHGIRDLNINSRLEEYFIHQKSIPIILNYAQKLYELIPRIKARFFLRRTVKKLTNEEALFFKHFYNVRKSNHYIETLKQINSPLRISDAYISFSREVYKVHQNHDFLPKSKKVHIIGFPAFDHFASIKTSVLDHKQIILIEQGLATRNILGWTLENHKIFIQGIAAICEKEGFKLFVKLHPVQSEIEADFWEAHENIKLINNEQLRSLLPNTAIILGFFSTLMLPLAAMQHTTIITLENHPIGKLDVSKSWIDAGVAHPIYSLEKLPWALENIELLHQKQLPNKKQFEKDWLYKFDGKAGERLRDILLSDEL